MAKLLVRAGVDVSTLLFGDALLARNRTVAAHPYRSNWWVIDRGSRGRAPRLSSGSSAAEHRFDTPEVGGSTPPRNTYTARWAKWESRLPFKQDTVRVRDPSAPR